uniref:Ras-GEF domain-containing protein n=1 Tax=Macrostomum lignano TaxID=282301 RepID=A0A1I8HNA6_9PLAT
MNWTSRPQLISFIRDHRSTLPHSYALRTARPGLAPDSFCLTKAVTDPKFAEQGADDSEQVNMAFESETFLGLAAPAAPGLDRTSDGGASRLRSRSEAGGKPQAAQRHLPSRPEPLGWPGRRPELPARLLRLAHPRQHQLPHQPLQFATPPKRSDSMPSPSSQPLPLCLPATLSSAASAAATTATPPAAVSAASSSSSAVVAQGGDEADIGTDGSRAAALQDGYDQVVFEFTKVPAEDFAREITLMFLPVFTAIQPDELTSVAWHGRDKELRAPNVVKFTRVFNHVNFWVQKCILETTSLSNRATVLAHFIKIAKKLYELQNLHGTFAVVAALQSQPIFRLKKTWSSLPRKHVEAFERLSDLFSANSNHERLRRLMQDIRQPVIPYLGLYMNDLVYIDTCHPSTGGLESQARKDKMNNICRVLSDYQQSQYSFQSKEHVRRYLEGQTYIEEMQSFVEAANYKTSRDLEPHDSGGSGGGGLVAASGAGIHQHDSLRLPEGSEPGHRGRLDSQGSDSRTSAGHRKSKSFSDASVVGCCSATPVQQAGVQRHLTIGPNSEIHHRNLIDDSPAFATGCACAVTPAASAACDRSLGQLSSCSQSPNASATPLMSGLAVRGAASVAPNRQIEEALRMAPVICQGALQRKVVYKSGRKQTRSSYVRFWAELVVTENGSHPLIRLYAAAKPFASDRREDFKRQCKKQQDLSDASVVVFENTSQCSDPEHTFQINFDLSDRVGSFRLNSSEGKFCSYKYRVSPGSRRQTRDFWVAQIKRAIQQSKKEKSLIDFEEDSAEAGAAAAAPSGVAAKRAAAGNLNNNRSESSLHVIEESTQL